MDDATLERVRSHLQRAQRLVSCSERLDATSSADCLACVRSLVALADSQESVPRSFWEALWFASENLGAGAIVRLCKLRMLEVEKGFVEARLSFFANSRSQKPIVTGSNLVFAIGRPISGGDEARCSGSVSVEGVESINRGDTALVRIHPVVAVEWQEVAVGMELAMYRGGGGTDGVATVTRVDLRPA